MYGLHNMVATGFCRMLHASPSHLLGWTTPPPLPAAAVVGLSVAPPAAECAPVAVGGPVPGWPLRQGPGQPWAGVQYPEGAPHPQWGA